MTAEYVAIGLAGAVGILLLGKPLDWLLRERPGRWIAPEAWIPLLMLWNVGIAAALASGYENALNVDFGAAAGELRKTATASGTPLIALAGIAVLARWRLLWERRRVPLVLLVGAMFGVAVVGAVIGFAADNAPRYIASDTWRWVVLPLYGVLSATEERPRAWPMVLAPAAIGAMTIATSAWGTIGDIGDAVKPGPVSTLTFVGTAVAVGWAARCHRKLLVPLALLLLLEGIITISSAARTAAVLAGISVTLAILLARRRRAMAIAAGAAVIPAAILAVAILQVDSVRDWAQPTLDRWELRVDQELIPRGIESQPEPESQTQRLWVAAADPRAETAALLARAVAQGSESEPDERPGPEPEPPTYARFSSVGERREEVEASTDWLMRGSPPVDALRLVVGLGQGVQYAAPRLPPLDANTKPGYRHHIHVTYVGVLVRNGAVGFVVLLAALVMLVASAIRAIRRLPAGSMEGLAARVTLVAAVVFSLEMVTGFVFIGTFEGGAVMAGAVALAIRNAGDRAEPA